MFSEDIILMGLMILCVISSILSIYLAIQCAIVNQKIRQLIERRRLHVR